MDFIYLCVHMYPRAYNLSFYSHVFYIFIYLAVLGLSCGMQDL